MKTNSKQLVELSVWGTVTSAVWPASRPYRMGGDGAMRVLPGTGGICYSHQVGDNVCSLKGDHVEPGVTIKAPDKDDNSALNTFACIGNTAKVISGDAKGSIGTVVGKHGGIEHVMIDFPLATFKKLCIGANIQIQSIGTGLELSDHPETTVMSCSAALLKAWKIKSSGKFLDVPVTHIVPAKIMGSGLGCVSSYNGDYDIQMFDERTVREHKLESLRFGDLVAITDADHTYGRRYLGGAVSVGVIVHSRSDMSGHGPGVTTLLTSKTGRIKPRVVQNANIGYYLKIGRWRNKKKK